MWRAEGARTRDRSFFDKVPKADLERLSRERLPGLCSARAADGGLSAHLIKESTIRACATYLGTNRSASDFL
jgi:hypothetical protein